MPWVLRPDSPYSSKHPCPECNGTPPVNGDGTSQCPECDAVLLLPDPKPGELLTLKLIPVNNDLTRKPRRSRRGLEIKEGYKRQADGSVAKIYRLINQMSDRYIEEIRRDGELIHRVDEPLSKHRGHGSAKGRQRSNEH